MLELIDITFKVEDKVILNGISLKIEKEKFIAITGPNGSGKSTLAKIIMGLEKPTSGKIIYNEKDITNLSVNKRADMGIAYAFQQPVRFKGITVYDLLKLASGKDISKQRCCEILSSVGLCALDYIDRELNSSLSGGELKRIEIASVALRNSTLTIFDEPEAGIDLWSFNHLIDVFIYIRNSVMGSTIVISHQERILNIADEVILMKDGRIEKIYYNQEDFNEILENKKCELEAL